MCDIIRTGNTINTKCLIINQKNYIDCISEIKLSTERLKEKNSLLSNEERQLDWVPGISRPDISFSVFEAGSMSSCTLSQQNNKNIKNFKNEIKFLNQI